MKKRGSNCGTSVTATVVSSRHTNLLERARAFSQVQEPVLLRRARPGAPACRRGLRSPARRRVRWVVTDSCLRPRSWPRSPNNRTGELPAPSSFPACDSSRRDGAPLPRL